MKDVEVVEIDGVEYAILKEIKHNNNTYVYLSNIKDNEDILIQKLDLDDPNTTIPISDDNEFEIACNLLLKNTIV